MDKAPRPRQIDVLIYNGVNLLDVAGPVQAFAEARHKGQTSIRTGSCRRMVIRFGHPAGWF